MRLVLLARFLKFGTPSLGGRFTMHLRWGDGVSPGFFKLPVLCFFPRNSSIPASSLSAPRGLESRRTIPEEHLGFPSICETAIP